MSANRCTITVNGRVNMVTLPNINFALNVLDKFIKGLDGNVSQPCWMHDFVNTRMFTTKVAMLHALHRADPFQSMNSQGIVYAETPCWSLLAMPVPELHSEETEERRRLQRMTWRRR